MNEYVSASAAAEFHALICRPSKERLVFAWTFETSRPTTNGILPNNATHPNPYSFIKCCRCLIDGFLPDKLFILLFGGKYTCFLHIQTEIITIVENSSL